MSKKITIIEGAKWSCKFNVLPGGGLILIGSIGEFFYLELKVSKAPNTCPELKVWQTGAKRHDLKSPYFSLKYLVYFYLQFVLKRFN